MPPTHEPCEDIVRLTLHPAGVKKKGKKKPASKKKTLANNSKPQKQPHMALPPQHSTTGIFSHGNGIPPCRVIAQDILVYFADMLGVEYAWDVWRDDGGNNPWHIFIAWITKYKPSELKKEQDIHARAVRIANGVNGVANAPEIFGQGISATNRRMRSASHGARKTFWSFLQKHYQ